jgi:hypothetical protein
MNKYAPWYTALLCLVVLAGCRGDTTRRAPRMNPRYMYRDKEPMGTNMAYRLLPQQFSGEIAPASKKITKALNILSYSRGTVYISIGKDIALDNEELNMLLNYVDRGNEFFIAADGIDRRLLDTLGIKQANNAFEWQEEKRAFSTVAMADTQAFSSTRYGFYYFPMEGFFSRYDSSTTVVLGVGSNKKPDYIVTRYGKGKFYFHLAPAAFSNYFLLTDNNTNYYSQVFSYLNREAPAVYWGDTYRLGNKETDFSALDIFWKNPPLTYALLLACLLILLYIGFGSKRKRRLVPSLPVNTNESVSFVHTITNLYLQKKDNRNIAVKMITYFFEYVRSSYYLSAGAVTADFVQALARKSGVEESRVQELMQKAEYLNNTDAITDQELFEINNLIHEFYKN